MRVAVIGSGAAALGVLDRLAAEPCPPHITLFDRREVEPPAQPPVSAWTPQSLRRSSATSRSSRVLQFPPPKANFGLEHTYRRVEDWGRVWDSALPGGLTNFWGLSAVPFDAAEFARWPVAAADLADHYRAIAERIGITGRTDRLAAYLCDEPINRPPIPVPPIVEALEESVNALGEGERYRLVAGAARLALETRPDRDCHCIACGECRLGCPRGAMYSTVRDIEAWRRSGLIGTLVPARVLAISADRRMVVCLGKDGARESVGPFDAIYVCAGCINTTEIAMRTLAIEDGPEVVDNAAFTFPIVHFGRHREGGDPAKYIALTNLLVLVVPKEPGASPVGQIQIYPMIDDLWRYYLPVFAWGAASYIGRHLRRRVLLGLVFLHGRHSQRYAIRLRGDDPASLHLSSPGISARELRPFWADVRRAFGGEFRMLPGTPLRLRTSAHYAATLPAGEGPVAADSSIAPGVYLCDSSVFPAAPAASPTFTIMANARRIAHDSLAQLAHAHAPQSRTGT